MKFVVLFDIIKIFRIKNGKSDQKRKQIKFAVQLNKSTWFGRVEK